MVTERAVRDELARLLTGSASLAELDAWVGERALDVRDSPPAAQELIWSIELGMAEYTSGHRTGAELRGILRALLDQVAVTVELTQGAAPWAQSPRTSSRVQTIDLSAGYFVPERPRSESTTATLWEAGRSGVAAAVA